LSKSRDKARVVAMVKIWKNAGSLVVVEGLDNKGTARPFIEVSEAAK
jgi:hypothetical protein